MSARLILEDEPESWVEFTHNGATYRALRDPMGIGHEFLSQLVENPRLVWRLFDEPSQIRSMTAAYVDGGLYSQLEAYLEAVGLSIYKVALAAHAVENIDLLEVDLLRIGLDVRDWLDPAGGLSTRRVVALYEDMLDRPETRVGAQRWQIKPADKAALAVALFHTSMVGQGMDHSFLKSPAELEREAEEARIAAEKRERMSKDRRAVLTDGSGASFESSTSESLRMLEEIQAAREGGEEEGRS